MGPQLSLFFENEKAALIQQINAEFEKVGTMLPSTYMQTKFLWF